MASAGVGRLLARGVSARPRAAAAAALVRAALLVFARVFASVADHPARLQSPMVVLQTCRPWALSAAATLSQLGFSTASHIACASAAVAMSVRTVRGTPFHPCFFHRLMLLAVIGRPAAVNRAATL